MSTPAHVVLQGSEWYNPSPGFGIPGQNVVDWSVTSLTLHTGSPPSLPPGVLGIKGTPTPVSFKVMGNLLCVEATTGSWHTSNSFLVPGGTHSISVSGVLRCAAKITLASGLVINGEDIIDGVFNARGKIVAKVTGVAESIPFTVYSAGSGSGPATSGIVTVVANLEAPGQMRVKLLFKAAGDSSGINVSAAYCVTFVNSWGEESAPSSPTLVEFTASGRVNISATYSGYSNGVPVVGMNVYRTYGLSDTYILVNQTPISGSGGVYTYADESSEPQTTTALQSTGWDPPPQDLRGLTYVGNGFFCAYRGRDLLFSEPYRPHAWPYSMTFPDEVKSLVPIENGVLATTNGQPYAIYGAHPEQAAQQVINSDQAGVSLNSATRVSGTAAYVSHDGIITVVGGAAKLDASRGLFTREVWRNLFNSFLTGSGAELLLAEHDGRMVALARGAALNVQGQSVQGFLLDLEEPSGVSWLQLPMQLTGASVVRDADALYFGLSQNGVGAYAEAFVGSYLTLTWHSKDYVFPRPVSFGAAVILVEGAFDVTIFCNGVAIHTEHVTSGETAFRLPSVPQQKRWSVRFVGTGVVTKFEMGSTFQELQGA